MRSPVHLAAGLYFRCRARVRAARLLQALALTAGAVLTTGCHHQKTVAYQPPPPPVTPRHAPPSAASSHTAKPNTAKASAAVPMSPEDTPSAGFDDTSGKPVFTEVGTASWYGPPYHHRAGADGTIFDQNAMTAAHRTLPMGSTVRVTNMASGQSVLVRITDRGPFSPGRVLDLSLGAAREIGVWRPGVAKVKIEAFAHASADPAGRWCVQIGAFKDANDALDVKASLMQRYTTAKVIEFAGPTGHWVRINPAKPDLAHANEVAKSVESADPAALPYVVRIN